MHYKYSHGKGHRYTQFAGGIDDAIFTNPFLTNTMSFYLVLSNIQNLPTPHLTMP